MRSVDEDKVLELINSYESVGLINPISVDEEFTLICGAHRVAAAKKLGSNPVKAPPSPLFPTTKALAKAKAEEEAKAAAAAAKEAAAQLEGGLGAIYKRRQVGESRAARGLGKSKKNPRTIL